MNKFHDIFLELEQQIVQGDYQPGDLLPSENQLVETYNVSRETIRKALNLLINAGYIQKKQGKGSIVLNFKKFNFPISGVTSYKELQQTQHIESHTHVVSLEEIPVERNLAQLTGWTEGAPVWRLVRQREIEGEFDYLENDLGLAISYAQKEITVEPLTEMDKQLIGEVEGNHVVVVRSIMNLEDTRCFGYTESRHRLNKFKFVEFARRRKL